jgi:hypothetical protein
MNEFPSTPEPEDFGGKQPDPIHEPYQDGGYLDPTNGIVRPDDDIAVEHAQSGDQPESADIPLDPFGDPFREAQSVENAHDFNGVTEVANESVRVAAVELMSAQLSIQAAIAENPALADQLADLLATYKRLEQGFRDVEVKPLSQEAIAVNVLREQGLTLDTGRPAEGLGIEGFKQYWPGFEEAELGRAHLQQGVQHAMAKHAPFVRKETYTVGNQEHTRKVLNLTYDPNPGGGESVRFWVTPESVQVRFQAEGQLFSYGRYHLANEGSFSEGAEGLAVRRDTTNISETEKGVPGFGAAPTERLLEYAHQRRAELHEQLAAQRQEGLNDDTVCFAEIEHIYNMLDKAVPYGTFLQVLRVTENRGNSRSSDRPSPEAAQRAGEYFRGGIRAYLVKQGFPDDHTGKSLFY